MASNFDVARFKVISKGWVKPQLKDKVVKAFSAQAFPRLVLVEEKFYAANLCYKRLRNRNERYGKLKLTPNLLGNSPLRTLHSDEYFFFTCCGFIYQELALLRKQGLLLDLPQKLFQRLEELKDERRYHEHGKEWYWGEIPKKGVVSSKGDNFNFESNMQILREIYNFIISKI